jgi:hypothetical protein
MLERERERERERWKRRGGWRELRVLSYACSRAVLHIMQVARTLSKPTSPHMSQGLFCKMEEYHR